MQVVFQQSLRANGLELFNSELSDRVLRLAQRQGLISHSAALRGVLRVLQHSGPQFWGPAIGGSG